MLTELPSSQNATYETSEVNVQRTFLTGHMGGRTEASVWGQADSNVIPKTLD
jgi:hypothetical protein